MTVRRIVTGHDSEGRSRVVDDRTLTSDERERPIPATAPALCAVLTCDDVARPPQWVGNATNLLHGGAASTVAPFHFIFVRGFKIVLESIG